MDSWPDTSPRRHHSPRPPWALKYSSSSCHRDFRRRLSTMRSRLRSLSAPHRAAIGSWLADTSPRRRTAKALDDRRLAGHLVLQFSPSTVLLREDQNEIERNWVTLSSDISRRLLIKMVLCKSFNFRQTNRMVIKHDEGRNCYLTKTWIPSSVKEKDSLLGGYLQCTWTVTSLTTAPTNLEPCARHCSFVPRYSRVTVPMNNWLTMAWTPSSADGWLSEDISTLSCHHVTLGAGRPEIELEGWVEVNIGR